PTDDEAAALWDELTYICRDRLLRFESENFWEMGETGPCGPCSEIHIDRGPGACDRRGDRTHRCAVNAGCARYIELWNLVFIQHNRDEKGKLSDLPARHVDTGMGFERICTVLQGVGDNYAIDVLRAIVHSAEKLSGKRYGAAPRDDVSLRVIADHGRAVTFLVADGILPSGEGLGVDKDGFTRAMEAQRERARGAQRFADAEAAPELIAGGGLRSRFVGDRIVEWESEVLALLVDGREARGPVGAGAQVDVVT